MGRELAARILSFVRASLSVMSSCGNGRRSAALEELEVDQKSRGWMEKILS